MSSTTGLSIFNLCPTQLVQQVEVIGAVLPAEKPVGDERLLIAPLSVELFLPKLLLNYFGFAGDRVVVFEAADALALAVTTTWSAPLRN